MNLRIVLSFFFPIFFSAISFHPLHATHIVGGEMNYTCLGDNHYEVSLTIFRDCYNGDPRAWFDNPASIGVFNAKNEFLFEIRIALMGNDTLAPILSGECLVAPPSVCVHTTTYRAVVELQPIIGGYQLAYQRCCRNQTIVNILNPLATGATYGVTISERALLECNNNPKFREWPPIYICAGEPILFDQSAMDLDGDSIVYRLCTPLAGADQQFPQPQPPNPPPYRPIEWVDPPYGLVNMLNGFPGGEPLQIDARTGLLTGLPNTIGQFVVGICVEEYRDGELISTTRRDFQYNVGQCTRTVAAFFAPEIYCDRLTVDFENQSEEATDFLWFFQRGKEILATSVEDNPSYTFPDTGRYEVVLIARRDAVCSDTFRREIRVHYPSLQAELDWRRLSCSDSIRIKALDQSRDTLFPIVRRRWVLNPGGLTSDAENPEFVVPAAQKYQLSLEVESANGCIRSTQTEIEISIVETSLGQDSLLVCRGDSVRLHPDYNPAYAYAWMPVDLIADPADPNPLIFPEESVNLLVRITNPISGCQLERSVAVFVPPPLELSLPADTALCTTEWPLVASSNENTHSVRWAIDPAFIQIISRRDTAWVTPRGAQIYYVGVWDVYGCSKEDSVRLWGNGLELQLPPSPVICPGQDIQLQAVALDPADMVKWHWNLEGTFITGDDTAEPRISPRQIGRQFLVLDAANQFGCIRRDTIVLTVLDTIPGELEISVQFCKDYLVRLTSDDPLAPAFSWSFGDPLRPGARADGTSVQYRYPGPGEYEFWVTIGEGTACPDTLRRSILLEEDLSGLAIDYDLVNCADTALIHIRDASGLMPDDVVRRTWQIGNALLFDSTSFTWVLRSADSLPVQLILAQPNGCIDTLREKIAFPVLEIVLADTIRACPGEVVALNPQAAQPYRYYWSPAQSLPDSASANPLVLADTALFYRLAVTDSSGQCSLVLGVQLQVAPRYSFDLPPDAETCETSFTIEADMDALGSILWSEQANFERLVGEGPFIRVNPLENEQWYARATDLYGCSQEDSIRVVSRAIQVEIPDASTICIGDTLVISVLSPDDQMLSYDWQPTGSIVTGLGTGTIEVSPEQNTEFHLSLQNAFGCRLDTSVLVRIFNYIPPLEITTDRDTLYAPGEVVLEATSGATYRYFWSPTVGLSDPTGPITMVFVEETTTFGLVIRDGNGCINEAFITVVVVNPDCIEPNIFVPSAFTPNGDGINDIFIPRGLNIEELFLIIYDRWGEQVFESHSPQIGWDGTCRGAPLGPDVYGYYLELGCANGQRLAKKGNVTLLR